MPFADATPDDLFQALAEVSLTGIILFRPMYAADAATIVDLAYVRLNPAARQMLARPECPAESFLTLYPAAVETGIFTFYRDTFLADAPGRLEVNYQHDGLDNYFQLAARRAGNLLVVSFTDTADHDRTAAERALRQSQAREQAARAQAGAQAHELAQLNQELEARVFERTQALRHARAESEATARQLLRVTESLPSTSITSDQNGQVLYISPQWYAYTGMVPGDDVTAAWPHFIHPDDLPAVVEKFGVALAGGNPWSYELRIRGADGHYRWFASQGVPEPMAEAEAAGRPRQWFGSNLDIDELKRAQQQLEEKDQLLTSILSALPASVVTFEGEDLRFGFFNASYQRLVQGRAVPGHPAVAAFPEAEGQAVLTLLGQVLRTGDPYQGQEMPAYTRDPRTGQQQDMYLDLAYLPLRHGSQPPHAVLGFVVDVTDRVLARRQAEAAQAQALAATGQAAAQREAFIQVFEQTPAVVVLLRGPKHRIDYYNAAYQQLFMGRAQRGRSMAEMAPETERQGFVALLDRVYETGETHFGVEVPLVMAQPGGQPPKTHYFNFTYQRFEEDGQPAGISVFAYDVAEQVLARHECEAQQIHLAELFEQAPVAIAVVRGAQYVMEVVNPLMAQLWGRTPAQVRGQTLYEALPEVRGQGFQELLDQVVASGEAFVAQEVPAKLLRAGQLETVYLNFVYQPLRDAQGRIDRVAAVATDVTTQVLARQQLAEANEQLTASNRQLTLLNTDLDSFVYAASHDLKLPVLNLAGLFEELRRGVTFIAAAEETLLVPLIAQALRQLTTSLDDLAALGQAQQVAPAPAELVALEALVEDILHTLEPQVRAANARVTTDFAARPTLSYPRASLHTVLLNLLSNALKYADPARPSRIHCSLWLAAGEPVLWVKDNGVGFDAVGHGPELFQLFRRFHTHVEGTGVGLYLVNRLLLARGGYLEVDSQVGNGATFRAYLGPA